MSGPTGVIAPVPSRMTAIEQRLAALSGMTTPVPVATGASSPDTAGSTFASALAAAAGPTAVVSGAVTGAGGTADTWAIPWADGKAPSAVVPTTMSATTMSATVAASTAAAVRSAATAGASAAGTIRQTASTRTSVADPLAVASPLDGRLSQHFGPTTSKYSAPRTVDGVQYAHFHDGIDIAAPLGRSVRSIAAGEVEFAGRYPDGAQVVRVRHADGSVALYAHLGRGLDVKVGDRVAAGDRLGVVGMTGKTTGPHLHLELTVNGDPVDPQGVLDTGKLPGTTNGTLDVSVLRSRAADGAAVTALARFDKVAGDIPHAAAIRSAAVAAGIDPLLLASLVKHESGFRADAVSSAGAMGLTQLMPATAKAAHVTDPFDPVQNLKAGAKYLATNLRIYGRVDLALAAYQAGKGAVARAGGIPDSPTTHGYIDRILHTWAGYQEAAA